MNLRFTRLCPGSNRRKRDSEASSSSRLSRLLQSFSKEHDKVLRLVWNTRTNTFGFRVVDLNNVEYTRVGITRIWPVCLIFWGSPPHLIVYGGRIKARYKTMRAWSERIMLGWSGWRDRHYLNEILVRSDPQIRGSVVGSVPVWGETRIEGSQ